MKGQNLTEALLRRFSDFLRKEEKSKATSEKYIRDVRAFASYSANKEITKETVISYKDYLLNRNYFHSGVIKQSVFIFGLERLQSKIR